MIKVSSAKKNLSGEVRALYQNLDLLDRDSRDRSTFVQVSGQTHQQRRFSVSTFCTFSNRRTFIRRVSPEIFQKLAVRQ